MVWKYKCRVCGSYLDPGEGQICDECQDKQNGKRQQDTEEKERSTDHEQRSV